MAKRRGGSTEAGRSAAAEWRRAGATAHRARVAVRAVVAAGAALGLVGLARSQGALVAAGVVVALAGWWLRPVPDADRWRRGAEGEVATAALLARLPRRWIVRHDCALPGSRANIDHLVIGPTGVWAVDSKALRARLRVRRRAVWAGERRIDTAPSAWEASVASRLLAVEVVPIVAVHGGPLRRRGVVCDGVRVLPARRLVHRLRRGRRVLSRSEMAALAARAEELLPPA